jgi:hypothetical protein
MSDKKRNTFFHLIFCSRVKNIRFITPAPTPPPALVIKRLFLALEKNDEKKFYFFFIEQIVIKYFYLFIGKFYILNEVDIDFD